MKNFYFATDGETHYLASTDGTEVDSESLERSIILTIETADFNQLNPADEYKKKAGLEIAAKGKGAMKKIKQIIFDIEEEPTTPSKRLYPFVLEKYGRLNYVVGKYERRLMQATKFLQNEASK